MVKRLLVILLAGVATPACLFDLGSAPCEESCADGERCDAETGRCNGVIDPSPSPSPTPAQSSTPVPTRSPTATPDGDCPDGCESPPAASCASPETLRAWFSRGTCVDGSCEYSENLVGCPNGCSGGACDGDPCAGVTCNAPPGPSCVNELTVRVPESRGTCVRGRCEYGHTDLECDGFCVLGVCTGDPCSGVSCDTPPPSFCDGNTLRHYEDGPGRCNFGQCTYSRAGSESCEHGCRGGACLPDPCMGVVCDTPPEAMCSDANTLMRWSPSGQCDAGTCDYPASTEPCPHGCEDGACLPPDCVADGDCTGPAPVCQAAPATCVEGRCEFEALTGGECDDGDPCTHSGICGGGECRASPVICDTPPPTDCADLETLRTYEATGRCEAGGCDYEFETQSCLEGATCIDDADGARCVCDEGFDGDGVERCVPVTTREMDCGGVPCPMVEVPAGEFLMGCPPTRDGTPQFGGCGPERTVFLSAFYIDRVEVTVRQFRACRDSGNCPVLAGRDPLECNGSRPDHMDRPVNCLTWAHAEQYCAWANKRLPTEAEWEKAARGPDGAKFPWGDGFANSREICDRCFALSLAPDGCGGHSETRMGIVGTKPRCMSPYGAHDMSGNVSEWVADWYDEDYYTTGPAVDPPGPESGEFRVLRGTDAFTSLAEVYGRLPRSLESEGFYNGLRCAWSAD